MFGAHLAVLALMATDLVIVRSTIELLHTALGSVNRVFTLVWS